MDFKACMRKVWINDTYSLCAADLGRIYEDH